MTRSCFRELIWSGITGLSFVPRFAAFFELFAGPGAAVAAAADSRCPGGFVLTPEQLEAADRADRAAKAEKARVARGGQHAGGF